MVTVTSKGQLTLPVEIRRKLGIEPGDEVEVEILDEDSAKLKISKAPSLLDLYGTVKTEKSFPGKEQIREEVGSLLENNSAGEMSS